MPVMADLPEVLARLVDQLAAAGFRVESSVRSNSFGNRIVQLARGPVRVRLVRDRSQWSIDLSRDGWNDWFDPDLWRSCLDNVPIASDPSPLDEDAKFVVEAIEQISTAVGPRLAAWKLRSCLKRSQVARSKAHFGF